MSVNSLSPQGKKHPPHSYTRRLTLSGFAQNFLTDADHHVLAPGSLKCYQKHLTEEKTKEAQAPAMAAVQLEQYSRPWAWTLCPVFLPPVPIFHTSYQSVIRELPWLLRPQGSSCRSLAGDQRQWRTRQVHAFRRQTRCQR